jgi:hypothetical protein
METKTGTKATKTPMEKAYEELNRRVTVLEKLVQQLASQKPKARKSREYTDEERAAIRARLLTGQDAARKKREAESKSKTDSKSTKDSRKVNNTEAGIN